MLSSFQRKECFPVPVIDDDTIESNEMLKVRITMYNGSPLLPNVRLVVPETTITIVDRGPSVASYMDNYDTESHS